ncbi:hypothetical protein GCM10010300_23820 [Streptomyces olivaceoviridis]|nr:hypothetical protein GCM10010300_23820 [Streptomyces olivaceoviridis]
MQMDPFTRGEQQRVGQGRQHLHRGPAVAPLLQPGDVLDAHPGERRQFRAAQSRRAAARSGGQSHLGRCDGFPAQPQEEAELVVAHPGNVAPAAPADRGPGTTTLRPASLVRGPSDSVERAPDPGRRRPP